MILAEMWEATAVLNGRTVLREADACIQAGEVVAVCGPNGSGKTSLLRAMLGLLPIGGPGAVARLGEDDVRTLNARQKAERAAYLPQDRGLAWNMPAVEIAALGAPFLTRTEALDRAREVLEGLGAGRLADRGVAEMSGGERARVLLARALVSPGRALLVDEPAAGLDPDAQLLVMERLRAEARAGRGVMVSLHDLNLAVRYADRVMVMRDGQVITDDRPMDALAPWYLEHAFGLKGEWVEGRDGFLLSGRRA